MIPFDLAEPASFEEAVRLIDPEDPTCRPISGGTAMMPGMSSGTVMRQKVVHSFAPRSCAASTCRRPPRC